MTRLLRHIFYRGGTVKPPFDLRSYNSARLSGAPRRVAFSFAWLWRRTPEQWR